VRAGRGAHAGAGSAVVVRGDPGPRRLHRAGPDGVRVLGQRVGARPRHAGRGDRLRVPPAAGGRRARLGPARPPARPPRAARRPADPRRRRDRRRRSAPGHGCSRVSRRARATSRLTVWYPRSLTTVLEDLIHGYTTAGRLTAPGLPLVAATSGSLVFTTFV